MMHTCEFCNSSWEVDVQLCPRCPQDLILALLARNQYGSDAEGALEEMEFRVRKHLKQISE